MKIPKFHQQQQQKKNLCVSYSCFRVCRFTNETATNANLDVIDFESCNVVWIAALLYMEYTVKLKWLVFLLCLQH